MLMTPILAKDQATLRLSGSSAKTCPNIMLTIRLCIQATIITIQMNRRSKTMKRTLEVIKLTRKITNLFRTVLKALVLYRLLITNSHLRT